MDWKNIISQLIDKGYTQQQLAQKCGCGQATISELSRGETKSTRFEVGQKLLGLLEAPFEKEAE
jgi:transcriptional regulator with XRE-family HTH domain